MAEQEVYMLQVLHDDIDGKGGGFFMRVADYATREDAELAKAFIEKGVMARHVTVKVYGLDDPIP